MIYATYFNLVDRVAMPGSELGVSTPSRAHRSRKCSLDAAASLHVLACHLVMNCSGVMPRTIATRIPNWRRNAPTTIGSAV